MKHAPIQRAHNPSCPTPKKQGWVRRKDARAVLRNWRHNAAALRTGYRLDVYLCPCGVFHIGSRPPDARRSDLNHRQATP